jgi:hypothetical protein
MDAYFYIAYSANGRKVRENTHLLNEKGAKRLLDSRLGAIANGDVLPIDVSKTSVGDLLERVRTDYKVNALKSLDASLRRVRLHLAPSFYVVSDQDGKFTGGMKAVQVTNDFISLYVVGRQQSEASNATMNRELSVLRADSLLEWRQRRRRSCDAPTFHI